MTIHFIDPAAGERLSAPAALALSGAETEDLVASEPERPVLESQLRVAKGRPPRRSSRRATVRDTVATETPSVPSNWETEN
jgi:hypothetical protein